MPVQSAIQIQPITATSANLLAAAKSQDPNQAKQVKQNSATTSRNSQQGIVSIEKNVNEPFSTQNDSTFVEPRDTTINIYSGNPGAFYTEGDTLFYWTHEGFSEMFGADSTTIAKAAPTPYGFEGKPITTFKQDWVIGLIILGWIIFASLRTGFGKFLGQVFHSTVSLAETTRLYRDKSYNNKFGFLRLNAIFYLILPLSIFQLGRIFGLSLFGYKNIVLYLIIFVVVNAYFLIKQMLYSLTGSIIMLRDEIRELIFNMILYNSVLGIILLSISTVQAIQSDYTFITQWMIIGSIALFYLFSLFRTIYFWIRKGISIFYLILYLCTLEILPMLVVVKLTMAK